MKSYLGTHLEPADHSFCVNEFGGLFYFETMVLPRMTYLSDLAKDGGVLAAGLGPLAFLGQWGTPAVIIALLNLFVFGALRFYDIRLRSRERLEMARMRLELEAARGEVSE